MTGAVGLIAPPPASVEIASHPWAVVDHEGAVVATYRTAAEATEARSRTGHRRAVRDGQWWCIID